MPTVTSDVTSSAVIAPNTVSATVQTVASIQQPSSPIPVPTTVDFGAVVIQEEAQYVSDSELISNFGEDVPVGSVVLLTVVYNKIYGTLNTISDTKGNHYGILSKHIAQNGSGVVGTWSLTVNVGGETLPPTVLPGTIEIIVFGALITNKLIAGTDHIEFDFAETFAASQVVYFPALLEFSNMARSDTLNHNPGQPLLPFRQHAPLVFGVYYTNVSNITTIQEVFQFMGEDPFPVNPTIVESFLPDSGPLIATDDCIVVGLLSNDSTSGAVAEATVLATGHPVWDASIQAMSQNLYGRYDYHASSKTDSSEERTNHFFNPTWVVSGFGRAKKGDLIRTNSSAQVAQQFMALCVQLRTPSGGTAATRLDVKTTTTITSPFLAHDLSSSAAITTTGGGPRVPGDVSSSAAISVSSETLGTSCNVATTAIIE